MFSFWRHSRKIARHVGNLKQVLKWVLLWQRKYWLNCQIPLLPREAENHKISASPAVVSSGRWLNVEGGLICCALWMHWTKVSGIYLAANFRDVKGCFVPAERLFIAYLIKSYVLLHFPGTRAILVPTHCTWLFWACRQHWVIKVQGGSHVMLALPF